MRTNLIFFLFMVVSCSAPATGNNDHRMPDSPKTTVRAKNTAPVDSAQTRVPGDFNGDEKKEYAWVESPAGVNADSMDCAGGDCTATIRFSDPSIAPIPVRQCIGGQPDNLGDLNGDGADEIGLRPDWFTSCWAGYHAWTYAGGSWREPIASFSVHCIQWDEAAPPVKKIPGKPGWVRIRFSESDAGGEEGIRVKEREVKLR